MSNTNTTVRVLAEYQLFSEDEGVNWMTGVLAYAKGEETIVGYDVHTAIAGVYGIQMISFTVDVAVTQQQLRDPKPAMTGLLNRIIHDTDVQVRWIGLL